MKEFVERLTPEDWIETINMPQNCDMTRFALYAHRLWEIENLIESGRLVELPCYVGDTVYETDTNGAEVHGHTIRKIIYDCGAIAFDKDAIGTRIYLTREDAEERAKYLQEKADAYTKHGSSACNATVDK